MTYIINVYVYNMQQKECNTTRINLIYQFGTGIWFSYRLISKYCIADGQFFAVPPSTFQSTDVSTAGAFERGQTATQSMQSGGDTDVEAEYTEASSELL